MAQSRRPAPPRAAATFRQNPASGLEPCPVLPSRHTLHYPEEPDAIARCSGANSRTDAEYRGKCDRWCLNIDNTFFAHLLFTRHGSLSGVQAFTGGRDETQICTRWTA